MKCDLCGQSVKIVGDTTKHFEGMEREIAIEDCAEFLEHFTWGMFSQVDQSTLTGRIFLAALANRMRSLK